MFLSSTEPQHQVSKSVNLKVFLSYDQRILYTRKQAEGRSRSSFALAFNVDEVCHLQPELKTTRASYTCHGAVRRCWKATVLLDILDTSSEALEVFLTSKLSAIHCAICNPIVRLFCRHQNHQNKLLIRSEKIGCDASFASKQYASNIFFGHGSSFCSVSLESKGIKKCMNMFMPCASLRKPTTLTWPCLYKK